MLRFVLPVLLVLFAVAGFFGLMVVQQLNKEDGGENVISGVFATIFSDISEIGKSTTSPGSADLAAYLPEAPEGWFRKNFDLAEAEALTETTYRASAVSVSTNNSRMGSFVAAQNQRGGTAFTYLRGESRVLVAVSSRSERDMRSFQGSIVTAISGNIAGVSDWNKNDFATVDGIRITLAPSESVDTATRANTPVNYRTFNATMGGQLSLLILTNASDAAVVRILDRIDFGGLNASLVNPDPNYTQGTGVITRLEGEPSTQAPEPTIAYQAFKLLRAGADLSQSDVRLLQTMAAGEVEGWDQLLDEFGIIEGYSVAVTDILGPRPEETYAQRLQRQATTYLRMTTPWEDHEEDILNRIKSGRLSNISELRYYFEEEKRYAPEIIALLNMLPEEVQETADAEIPAENRELIVRRGLSNTSSSVTGGNCKIEHGVRRCSFGDDG